MKNILTIAIIALLGSSFAFAEMNVKDQKAELQNERKTEMINLLNNRISNLDTLKRCIYYSKSHEDVKACRKASHENRKQISAKSKELKKRAFKQNKKMKQGK